MYVDLKFCHSVIISRKSSTSTDRTKKMRGRFVLNHIITHILCEMYRKRVLVMSRCQWDQPQKYLLP